MFASKEKVSLYLDVQTLASQADDLLLQEPKPDVYGRFHTLNKFGYMFGDFDQVAKEFLDEITKEKNKDAKVLEIGCAYGNVAFEAIKKGCNNYIANDISLDHLRVVAKKIKEYSQKKLLDKIELLNAKFPSELDLPKNYVKFGLINKVLHFLNPSEIELAMKVITNITMKTGRWYVLTVSPRCKDYKKFEKEYRNRKMLGIPFPGFCRDAQLYSTDNITTSNLPTSMLFMDVDELSNLFVNAGFKIIKSYSLKSPSNDNKNWTPGNDMVGIIAEKL